MTLVRASCEIGDLQWLMDGVGTSTYSLFPKLPSGLSTLFFPSFVSFGGFSLAWSLVTVAMHTFLSSGLSIMCRFFDWPINSGPDSDWLVTE